jgi:hypothetical protein
MLVSSVTPLLHLHPDCPARESYPYDRNVPVDVWIEVPGPIIEYSYEASQPCDSPSPPSPRLSSIENQLSDSAN